MEIEIDLSTPESPAHPQPPRLGLAQLARLIHDVHAGGIKPASAAPGLPTGWSSDPQSPIARLAGASVHEWSGLGPWYADQAGPLAARRWSPPMSVLVHLAWQAVAAPLAGPGHVVWIGRACWPYARQLVRTPASTPGTSAPIDRRLLDRSLFVDTPNDASRLWAIDLCLRSPAATLVIADGSRLSMTASRRLQLAAEAGGSGGDGPSHVGGLALLARPAWELAAISSSATRWTVSPEICSGSRGPCWRVRLQRLKGSLSLSTPPAAEPPSTLTLPPVQSIPARTPPWPTHQRSWLLEWDHDHACCRLSADPAHRPAQSPPLTRSA